MVFLPKQMSKFPAIVVELKWDKSFEGAIEQIKAKNNPTVLRDYGGEIVMVGISYNAKIKAHTCKIERVS